MERFPLLVPLFIFQFLRFPSRKNNVFCLTLFSTHSFHYLPAVKKTGTGEFYVVPHLFDRRQRIEWALMTKRAEIINGSTYMPH